MPNEDETNLIRQSGDDSAPSPHSRLLWPRSMQAPILILALSTIAFPIFVLAFSVLSLLPGLAAILERKEQQMAAELEGMKKIPDLTVKIQKLDSQLSIMTSSSITTRLDTLEKALNAGDINPEDVATLQQVKEELDTLKTYMLHDPRELVELKELQTNYRNLDEGLKQAATKEWVSSSISNLQNTVNVVMWAIGIILTICLGSWWFTKRRETPTRPLAAPGNDLAANNESNDQP